MYLDTRGNLEWSYEIVGGLVSMCLCFYSEIDSFYLLYSSAAKDLTTNTNY
jgi:hypothetical protein